MKTFYQNRWVWPAARLIVGGLFLVTGIAKISDINGFIDEVNGYGLLPNVLAQLVGWVLPWVELLIGCALFLGVFERAMAVLILPMSIIFGIAGIYAIVNDSGIRCGCFGSLIPLTHQQSLIIDIIMILTSVLLVMDTGKDFLTLSHLFDRIKPGWRSRRPVWFNAAQIVGVLLVAAMVTAIVFGIKNMRGGETARVENPDAHAAISGHKDGYLVQTAVHLTQFVTMYTVS